MKVKVKIAAKDGVKIPRYMTSGSAGLDIRAYIKDSFTIKSMERIAIPTGIHLEIPVGYEVQVRPRSGLALKHGITLINTPGTIDSDFRGEIKILMINMSNDDYNLSPNERIGQLVLSRYEQMDLIEVDGVEELEDTVRGSGGFGHTGKK